MTIHDTHPFADPEPDEVRRFRGRLGGAVTLWTAGSADERSGLTVTSLMLAHGEEPRVLALLDPDSDLAASLEGVGVAVVQLLSWTDRGLAEAFAGTAPAPGGLFRQAEFVDTDWGPRLASATTWAGVRLETSANVGWSRLVTCLVEQVVVGADTDPLGHRRGRFTRLRPPGH
jgi:flavin reductase (DIM6/NTAB) family NADH-FMN oxidoreductase RutF